MKKVLAVDSIDSFVAEGIFNASDEIGEDVDIDLRISCEGNRDNRQVLINYIIHGDSIAYLIFTVENSLKETMSDEEDTDETNTPRNKIAEYAFKRRPKVDVVHLVEHAKREIEYQEARGHIYPLMKDMADFLMIAMTVNQGFLSGLAKKYTLTELEDKASRYYGQAALDFRKLGAEKGFVTTLKQMSNEFDKYMSIMRFFSSSYLNQKVIQLSDIAKLSPEVKTEMFEQNMDRYLEKLHNYRTMVDDPLGRRDDTLIQRTVTEVNDLGKRLAVLSPEFKHKEIKYPV